MIPEPFQRLCHLIDPVFTALGNFLWLSLKEEKALWRKIVVAGLLENVEEQSRKLQCVNSDSPAIK